jgi:hypothetical protein
LKTRPLFLLSLILVVSTTLWVILLAAGGPAETFEAALEKAYRRDAIFIATYLNAGLLITIPAALLMGELYRLTHNKIPEWLRLAGLLFTPVYAALNLVAYLSQIAILPGLVELHRQPETQASAGVLLRMAIQELPGSGMAFINGLAYAVLSIPSLAFGLGLYRMGGLLRVGGLLLALSGLASLVGFLASILNIAGLDLGVVVGGGLFLFALIPMVIVFSKTRQ